jgi:hypothetical protein
MNRTFAAIIGANNVAQLEEVFKFLAKNGTELIIEAADMDKYRNAMVDKGASKIYLMARKCGMDCQRLTWNPNYKGIDDWQLALHRKMTETKENQNMNLAEHPPMGTCRHQRFRIYQLDFEDGKTRAFAFAGIEALRKAGYQQPPAADYCLAYDGEIICPSDQCDSDVLERIFERYNDGLPGDYHGRSVAPSDVVELYDSDRRSYFYCDTAGFAPVKFSPMLVKRKRSDDAARGV